MAQFWTLLKIEFMSRSQRNSKGSKLLPQIIKWIVLFAGVVVIAGVILFAFNSVIKICIESDLTHEFLIYFILLMQIVQILFGLGLTTKTLYFSQDKDLLKLPVNGTLIYLAKIAYLFICELAFSTILTLPVFIEFGILSHAGVWFYLRLIPNVIFFPMIPFLIGLLLSVPAMYIVAYLKNKFVVMLILYVVFVALGFSIYIYVLKFILALLQSGNLESVFSDTVIVTIKNFSNYMYPQVLIKNLIMGYHYVNSLIINVTVVAVLGVAIYYFSRKVYLRILLNNLESENNAFSKKTNIKERSVGRALFFREFVSIFRSVNYSFQYLTVVITTPLMVYFSNAIASNIGAAQLGNGMLPGISVLVLIMFLSMGSSFAATSFTREGGNFFHTKIIPVSYAKQVTVKFFMYVIVAIPSIALSCLTLAIFDFLSYLDALLIAVAVILVIIGNIASSISLDMKRPQFMYLDGKELTSTTKNMNTSLSIGFIIAALMGVGSIIISFLLSLPAIYIVLFGFSVPYMGISVFTLFFRVNKRYRNIEA